MQMMTELSSVIYPRETLWSPRAGDGCVLWMPGQDDAYSATIRDRSGKGNHGTIYGATWTRLSSGLWVLSFDGVDDVIDIADSLSLRPVTDQYSVMSWFKTDIAHGGGILCGTGGVRDFWFYPNSVTGFLQLYLDGKGPGWMIGTTPVIANTWNLLGFSYDGVHIIQYINGLPKDTFNATGNLASIADSWHIGGHTAGSTDHLLGQVALNRVVTSAISATKWAQIFNQERHLFGI